MNHGIDLELTTTHGKDLASLYSIGTLESHTYEKAECCPYARFSMTRPSGPGQS